MSITNEWSLCSGTIEEVWTQGCAVVTGPGSPHCMGGRWAGRTLCPINFNRHRRQRMLSTCPGGSCKSGSWWRRAGQRPGSPPTWA